VKDFCVRCGLPENERHHKCETSLPEGWHPFLDQSYIDGLEDALLFAREINKPHQWKSTGVTIDINPSFAEKVCMVCGEINWGGKETGVCFGNSVAASALNAARNRRAARFSVGDR
jgi:hypothetical protein